VTAPVKLLAPPKREGARGGRHAAIGLEVETYREAVGYRGGRLSMKAPDSALPEASPSE
jgi:hypothetical protein